MMAVHVPDFVRVTIDGTDRTAYVVSYARHSTLCTFSDTFTLELSFEIPATPDPYDSIVINELYDGENEKVIGGYIIDVVQNFDNGNYIINGQDKTLLLDDYFIHTQTIANNETVAYWMNYYAGLVGLSVQYDSSVTQFIVEEGTPMGMITASDGMGLLERLAAVYIKYDATIDKLRVFRINTSEPVIQITNNETTKFDRERSTDKTRNIVKVYGAQRYNIFSGTTTRVTAKAVTNLDELVVDKTAVIANPHVRRVSTAQLIATRVLQIIDDIDDVLNIETAGFYPQVDVGDYMGLDIGTASFDYSADREITSIQTTVDTNGVVTIFTVGEKCPRVSIMPPTTAVYATARNGGVLVSWNAGEGFEPFNKGIVSQVSELGSGIDGTSIAANQFGQLMAIVDNTLYKRTGKYGSWTDISANLSNPSDDEGEVAFGVTDLQLQKVEKEANAWSKFHFLANITASGGIIPSGQERWWIYWTPDFGTSWDSMQLYVTGSGVVIGAPSGIPPGLTNGVGITHLEMQTAATLSGALIFNVDAKDVEGGNAGDVTVLVQGEPKFYIPPDTPDAETFHGAYIINPTVGTKTFLYGGTWTMDDYTNYFVEGLFPNEETYNLGYMHDPVVALPMFGLGFFSVPNNREVAYFQAAGQGLFAIQGYYAIRTKGEYYYGVEETDLPDWEHIPLNLTEPLQGIGHPLGANYYFLYDYSSLKAGTTTSRWVALSAGTYNGALQGEYTPGGDTLKVNAVFFEDDIAVDANDSYWAHYSTLSWGYPGGEGYDGDGLFGWVNIDPTTESPAPRGIVRAYPQAGGTNLSAITINKSGSNTGYAAFALQSWANKHGDARDAGCTEAHPNWPNCFLRDWGENVNVGIVVAEFDFDSETVSTMKVGNFDFSQYHINPPTDDDGMADWNDHGHVSCHMVNPDLIWVRTRWNDDVEDHGGYHEYWISYPDFTILSIDYDVELDPLIDLNTRTGVLKVPYFGPSMIARTNNSRGPGDGDPVGEYTDTTDLFRRASQNWVSVSPPPVSPIGQVLSVKQNPYFGVCITEEREVPSDQWHIGAKDYTFMWKAQRADPTSYVVMGTTDGVLDPYAAEVDPAGNHRLTWWDFRTAVGSYGMENGGSQATWNFVE